jgi:predicted RNA-binding Zn ribbon-like protein
MGPEARTGESVPSTAPSERHFLFIGNALWVDFVNTQVVEAGRLVDRLCQFDDLVAWLVQAQVIDALQAQNISTGWGGRAEAASTLAQALAFRAQLRRMLERIIASTSVPQAAITAINIWLSRPAGHTEVRRIQGGFARHFQAHFEAPTQLLFPIAESACNLLCSGDLSLLRKCENTACVLFFYDTTKNHRRRWCSMAVCGNRMKVTAHYRRQRLQARPQ